MPDTDPPRCAAHRDDRGAHGAPAGNTNAREHGFYSPALDAAELADLVSLADDPSLDDEIAAARVALRRVLAALDTDQPDPRLASLAFAGTRTIARLLRDQRAISGDAADGIAGAIAQALDELSTEWGIDL